MILPPYLVKGDKIAIVSPARKISVEELSPALEQIRNWGFEPVLGKNVYCISDQFAGTDEQRLSDMQWALNDNSISAILASRGGYGCLRLIDKLDFTQFINKPKWIVGYSDLTVFHSHINKQYNVATIHATMPINFAKDKGSTNSILNALTGIANSYNFSREGSKIAGEVNGIVVGGNLSLLYAMQGSSSDIDTKGKLLFIEDLDEHLYHIDRMMVSLKRSGKLSNLKALLVGSFTEMKDSDIPFGKSAKEIVLDAVKECNYPVFFNFPSGHQDLNCAIVFGKESSITINGKNYVFTQ